jgi:hypothetical protein
VLTVSKKKFEKSLDESAIFGRFGVDNRPECQSRLL